MNVDGRSLLGSNALVEQMDEMFCLHVRKTWAPIAAQKLREQEADVQEEIDALGFPDASELIEGELLKALQEQEANDLRARTQQAAAQKRAIDAEVARLEAALAAAATGGGRKRIDFLPSGRPRASPRGPIDNKPPAFVDPTIPARSGERHEAAKQPTWSLSAVHMAGPHCPRPARSNPSMAPSSLPCA